METKTLVVDVDDTISTHVNRDYENAIPHREIIDKLNNLRKNGWKIIYHTARGQVSCNGDIERIKKERLPVLIDWMNKNDVQYDDVLVGKPLGFYYIDDKSVRPDEFIEMEYKVLKGGSNALIERLGNRVIKQAPNAKNQFDWYMKALDEIPIPKIYTYYGDTIDMEYLDGQSMNEVLDSKKLHTIFSYVKYGFKDMQGTEYSWNTMIERINASFFDDIVKDPKVVSFMEKNKSFCHGDLTLENMIFKSGIIYFIDPNMPEELYSSWILDIGKLYQSLHYSYEEHLNGQKLTINKTELYSILKNMLTDEEHYMALVCELIHYIRMIKYRTNYRDVSKIFEIIEKLKMEIYDLRQKIS